MGSLQRVFKKGDWVVIEYIIALIHAFIASMFGAYTLFFFDPFPFTNTSDSNYWLQPYPYSNLALGITTGYFLWHSYYYVFVARPFQYDMILHSAICLPCSYVVIASDKGHRASISLFYEFSTIFLCVYCIFRHFEMHFLKRMFQLLFVASFFYCRIFIGTLQMIEIYQLFVFQSIPIQCDESCRNPFFYRLAFVALLFYLLNLYWMGLIIRKLIRTLRPKTLKEN